jgi:LacI family transcriptional regulator
MTNPAANSPPVTASSPRRVLMALGYYDLQLHRGITRYAREAGWALDTSMAHYGVIPEHWRGDGVITILLSERDDITRFIRRQKVPVVALYADAPRVRIPRVVLDDVRIGQLAAEHLLERGFTDLGFYRFSGYQAVREREAGFRHAVQQAGRNFHLLDWHGAAQKRRRQSWFDWLQRELSRLPLPIAIMAQSDHRATYLLSACEAAGLAVPEQVALIGVDNNDQACEFASVPLSSVDCDRESMAYEGAQLLDRLIRGVRPPRRPITIAPRGVVVRHSSDIYAVADPATARALQFIREHLREPIGVEDVIRASRTSRCGLYRAFHQHVGRSVGEEIDRQRVEHAKKLVRETRHKLHVIARLSGFSGAEHLTRTFRRVTGAPPSAYRRQLRSAGEAP